MAKKTRRVEGVNKGSKKKKKNVGYNILLTIFIVIFVISGALLLEDIIPRFQARSEMKKLQQIVGPVEMDVEQGIDFEALQKINPEIVAWITIPNTNIHYPILQCSNNDYYLNHTYTDEYNGAGSIFLDYKNSSDFSDQNTVIYGHSRLDGTMFRQLHKYRKQSGYEESPFIYIYRGDKVYYYQVFSANVVEATYDYRATSYGDNFPDHVKTMRASSKMYSNAEVHEGDKIISLSTCTNVIKDGRVAVLAVLLNPDGEKMDLTKVKK